MWIGTGSVDSEGVVEVGRGRGVAVLGFIEALETL